MALLRRDEKFAKGTSGFYGCRTCDWDVCPNCARRLQAGVAAVTAAVILAGRALEALADAWEQAKKTGSGHKRRRDKRTDCSDARRGGAGGVSAGVMADLPYQLKDDVQVMRTDGSWTNGVIDDIKEAMGTLCYTVVLTGEGSLKKTVPVKKADGKLRPRRGLSTGSATSGGTSGFTTYGGSSMPGITDGTSEADDSEPRRRRRRDRSSDSTGF